MRPTLLLLGTALLATVPTVQASCHWCVDDVVAACSSSDLDACEANTVHLATHGPEFLVEVVSDPGGFVCWESEAHGLGLCP